MLDLLVDCFLAVCLKTVCMCIVLEANDVVIDQLQKIKGAYGFLCWDMFEVCQRGRTRCLSTIWLVFIPALKSQPGQVAFDLFHAGRAARAVQRHPAAASAVGSQVLKRSAARLSKAQRASISEKFPVPTGSNGYPTPVRAHLPKSELPPMTSWQSVGSGTSLIETRKDTQEIIHLEGALLLLHVCIYIYSYSSFAT